MKSIKITTAILTFACANVAFANVLNDTTNRMQQQLSTYTLDCGHWYAGANVGMSHVHDKKNTGSTDSVNENGPGGSVLAGYQFNSMVGAELGYTQYKNSREANNTPPLGSFIVAKTDHYAVDLAATGRIPLFYQWSAIGKLGAAYSYAQKIATTSGAARSSGALAPYWGLGIDYSVTRHVDFILQFAEAVGNHLTGSTDLWSLGMNFAIT